MSSGADHEGVLSARGVKKGVCPAGQTSDAKSVVLYEEL